MAEKVMYFYIGAIYALHYIIRDLVVLFIFSDHDFSYRISIFSTLSPRKINESMVFVNT